MATTSTKTRKAPAARTRAAVEPAAAEAEVDEQPVDDAELDDAGALSGVIVDPELVFTTPKKDRPTRTVEERSIPWELDGEILTIIAPDKLRETLAPLIESGARRANESDVLFAGSTFLRKVLAPSSLARLQERLDDDKDDFEITDLYDSLERIAVKLIKMAPAGPTSGPVPARRRAR